jgi:hypothetical protein
MDKGERRDNSGQSVTKRDNMKNAKDYDLARTHLKESEEGDEAWL